jgi:hypothetical protein
MRKIIIALAAALMLIFTGCSKDKGYGRLVINITDAPFPLEYIESATVSITKVEIRKVGDGISDGSPFVLLWENSEEPKTFDLLELRNGVIAKLIDLEIPAGEYDLIRLYVDEAGLTLTEDRGTFSVKVPSGSQTGIKLFIESSLIVEGGLTSELMLDFDLSGSFLMQGNMDSPVDIKGFHFKPVIRCVNNSTAGVLLGSVVEKDTDPVVVIGGATITVKQGDDEIATAYSDNDSENTTEDGFYSIPALPSGTYSVTASMDGYESVTVEDVVIVAGNKTTVDFTLVKSQ